jgi:hypothetical protein
MSKQQTLWWKTLQVLPNGNKKKRAKQEQGSSINNLIS